MGMQCVSGSQRGQWQGRRGTGLGSRTVLALQDGPWDFLLWVELINLFFVLVVYKWVPQGQDRLSPWRFPRPLGHPPQPTPSLVQVWRLFGNFFWPAGGYLCPRAKTVLFPQSGTRGVWVQKGAVLGLPMSTLDGSIAGLVKHNIFS